MALSVRKLASICQKTEQPRTCGASSSSSLIQGQFGRPRRTAPRIRTFNRGVLSRRVSEVVLHACPVNTAHSLEIRRDEAENNGIGHIWGGWQYPLKRGIPEEREGVRRCQYSDNRAGLQLKL